MAATVPTTLAANKDASDDFMLTDNGALDRRDATSTFILSSATVQTVLFYY